MESGWERKWVPSLVKLVYNIDNIHARELNTLDNLADCEILLEINYRLLYIIPLKIIRTLSIR